MVADQLDYDAFGRNTMLHFNFNSGGAGTATFIRDGQNVVEELWPCCGNKDSLMGPGGLDDLFERNEPWYPASLFRDVRNSTLAWVLSGSVLGPQTYEPFGRINTGDDYYCDTEEPCFTGRPTVFNNTNQSPLVQLRGRIYNSLFQRFMSPDPIGYAGGSLNLYAYVNNDPMNWTDPLGLWGSPGDPGGGTGPGPGGKWVQKGTNDGIGIWGEPGTLPGGNGTVPANGTINPQIYKDYNFSFGSPDFVGVTGGVQETDTHWYPYIGLGVMSPGAGASVTYGKNTSPGFQIG